MLIVILAIAAFVFYTGWPSFSANGLAWFGTGDDPLDAVELGTLQLKTGSVRRVKVLGALGLKLHAEPG